MTKEKRTTQPENRRSNLHDETLLKISKEIAIKFIEMGRITPATFDENFKSIHTTIKETVSKE